MQCYGIYSRSLEENVQMFWRGYLWQGGPSYSFSLYSFCGRNNVSHFAGVVNGIACY